MYATVWVWIRGQLARLSSLLPQCGSQGSNSGLRLGGKYLYLLRPESIHLELAASKLSLRLFLR